MKFNELDCVRTLRNFPEYGIAKGETGVIIIAFNKPNEAYEVEFEDGTKLNIKDLDYKLIKPLIWWEWYDQRTKILQSTARCIYRR